MHAPINFTPGPSQLYFTVEDHIRRALREGIPSLSHRSQTFEKIFKNATEGLHELLNIPAAFSIVFTSSATEVWERTAQNLVGQHAHHLVNGAFSRRFFEIVQQSGKMATATEVSDGQGFDNLIIGGQPDLIAVTHNETSTGVSLPVELIHQLRQQHADAIIAVDAVSSLPYVNLDYNDVDTVFFSVQKGFGLPAGLGVWMVNERCKMKAEKLATQGMHIGTYHSLPSLLSNAAKHQTPETPNVLSIYLLAKVVEDMLRRGMQAIRNETNYKSALLYQTLTQHPLLNPFVQDPLFRSATVIVAESGPHTQPIVQRLQASGLYPGDGYGKHKKDQLRFANFPTHSREQYEHLVDTLATIS